MASNEPRLYIARYTDKDVDSRLAVQLRARGYDAISTFELGNQRSRDQAQFEYAISTRRTLLTHNELTSIVARQDPLGFPDRL